MIRHESMVIALAVLATLSGDVQGGNIQFRFEKLFPTLQQPWYFAPTGDITLDGDGFIYVAERENERVRKFTRDGQLVTNLGREGDSPGAFLNPVDLTVATNDLLYVTDQDRHRILVFTTDGAFVREFGEFGAGNGQFDRPRGIASRGEFLYVVDSFNQRIQKLNLDGDFVAQWGELGSGNGQFEFDAVPFRFRHADIAISPTGQVYVSDTRNHRIQYFDSEWVYLGQWGSEGEGIGQFNEPGALEVDEFGIVFVADRANRVQRFSADGLFLSRIDYPAEETAGNFLTGLAKASGRIYVRDLFRISQFLPTGEFADAFASSGKRLGQYNFPGGLAADPAGQIYMADQFNNRVQIHDADGKAIGVLGEAGPDPGQFSLPTAVAFDSQGRLFVSERGNDRVQVFDQSLNPAAIWGSSGS
ncbi:MAG: NHL repeat-containing protein [Pseudomonadota bacterium]